MLAPTHLAPPALSQLLLLLLLLPLLLLLLLLLVLVLSLQIWAVPTQLHFLPPQQEDLSQLLLLLVLLLLQISAVPTQLQEAHCLMTQQEAHLAQQAEDRRAIHFHYLWLCLLLLRR